MAIETVIGSRLVKAACFAGMTGLLAAGFSFPAAAQQPAQKAAPAKKKEAASAEDSGEWVKLCKKEKLPKSKDSKELKEVNVCLTHHERFDTNTGNPLVSAAVREVEGGKTKVLMVMVPLGRLLPHGMLLKVDDKEPITLPYNYCTQLGCVALAEATTKIVSQFKGGKELVIGTVSAGPQRRRIGFKVPLKGFTRALDGKPIDPKVYEQARMNMFKQIDERRKMLIKRAQEAQKQEGAAPAKKPQ